MSDPDKIMPYCLALETSARIGSVALGRGDTLLEVADFSAELRHAVELLPTVARLCDACGITPRAIGHVYVSAGPGSFTGLRIGLTVARTLCWCGRVQALRLPTLEVIAQNALAADPVPDDVGVVLDAKRDRLFAAAFRRQRYAYVSVTPPAEWEPRTFLDSLPKTAAVAGEGVARIRKLLAESGQRALPDALFRARAEVVYRLGRRQAAGGAFDPLEALVPFYVRRPEAEEVWERRHGESAV